MIRFVDMRPAGIAWQNRPRDLRFFAHDVSHDRLQPCFVVWDSHAEPPRDELQKGYATECEAQAVADRANRLVRLWRRTGDWKVW